MFYIQLSDHVRLLLLLLVSRVQLSVTPWTVAHQASLSFTVSPSLLKFMSIELVMPSNYLILCHSLLLLPLIFPSIRVFSNEYLEYMYLQYNSKVLPKQYFGHLM